MKYSEVKELTTKELEERIDEEAQAYQKLQFNHGVSGIENPLKIRGLRKLIARLHTEQRRRELVGYEEAKIEVKKEETKAEVKKETSKEEKVQEEVNQEAETK